MFPQNLMLIKVLRRRNFEDDILLENEDLVVDFKLFDEDWHYVVFWFRKNLDAY
jgi:hypothetical protein